MKIDIKDISKVNLSDGDVLVIRSGVMFTQETCSIISENFPDNRVVFLDEKSSLEVVSRNNSIRCEMIDGVEYCSKECGYFMPVSKTEPWCDRAKKTLVESNKLSGIVLFHARHCISTGGVFDENN